MASSRLDPRLKSLVNQSIAELGSIIRSQVGADFYREMEWLRKKMISIRVSGVLKKGQVLQEAIVRLEKLSPKDRYLMAHAFGLMLEIMNACESAYRSMRNAGEEGSHKKDLRSERSVYYVLTAHPTECRSRENLQLFRQLQQVLIAILKGKYQWHADSLRSLMEAAWSIPLTRQRKPEVHDEAEYIYSIVLNEEILETLLAVGEQVASVYLRSWVGGDKDGHPGVDEKAMQKSLQLSRTMILKFFTTRLESLVQHLELTASTEQLKQCRGLRASLTPLRKLEAGDGQRMCELREALQILTETYQKGRKGLFLALAQMNQLLVIFPGLVIPLEFRESSDLVMEVSRQLQKNKTSDLAIIRMLKKLKELTSGGDPRWYVRSFIISQTDCFAHIEAGVYLQTAVFGGLKMPVVPLFEQYEAMLSSSAIVLEMLKNRKIFQCAKKQTAGFLEIMLGYSDSAKEMGVLQSRFLIRDTVHRIERLCTAHGLKPLFFHGSGGSVDRGGGSIQEQTSWLPRSTLERYKATVQGEMVERTFSRPEIFRSTIESLVGRIGATEDIKPLHPVLQKFAEKASAHYQTTLKSNDFLQVVEKATPYRYLSQLRLGSRPSKRGSRVQLSSLRAIPWVLCWTQTRTLFPVWWGIGTAWLATTVKDRAQLRREFEKDPLFRSYIKLLGFTLAKVELAIWQLYLKNSGLSKERVLEVSESFRKEYAASRAMVQALSGEKNLLWYRPWLGESIFLRAPMVHPLNLLQILSRRTPELRLEMRTELLRETVAGIANGMLTTG